MKDLRLMTVEELAAVTASNAPAPGGGSISALAGALAAGLASMVASLSQGKKYEAVRPRMEELVKDLEPLRIQLLKAMQDDTEAFNLYMQALTMPKTTEQEQLARKAAMQEGLKAAAQTPLAVAQAIVPVFDILEELIRTGNPNAVTDALVGTMMARSGILGALFNVKVNLASIQDADFVQALEGKIRTLENQALEGERRVFALSSFSAHVL